MTKKKVEHGRIIGEGHSVEYFEHMQHWVSFVRNKYCSGMLTEDKQGRKLYISESSEDLTEEQIDSFVSYSLKTSIATNAAEMGTLKVEGLLTRKNKNCYAILKLHYSLNIWLREFLNSDVSTYSRNVLSFVQQNCLVNSVSVAPISAACVVIPLFKL